MKSTDPVKLPMYRVIALRRTLSFTIGMAIITTMFYILFKNLIVDEILAPMCLLLTCFAVVHYDVWYSWRTQKNMPLVVVEHYCTQHPITHQITHIKVYRVPLKIIWPQLYVMTLVAISAYSIFSGHPISMSVTICATVVVAFAIISMPDGDVRPGDLKPALKYTKKSLENDDGRRGCL